MLTIDNADNLEMNLSQHFPVGGKSQFHITTRNPEAELHATIGHLRFSGLYQEDAVSLLSKTACSGDELPPPRIDRQQAVQKIGSDLQYPSNDHIEEH